MSQICTLSHSATTDTAAAHPLTTECMGYEAKKWDMWLARVTAERDEVREAYRDLIDRTDQALVYLSKVKESMYECVYCGATKNDEQHKPDCEVEKALTIMKERTHSITAERDEVLAQLATLEARVEASLGAGAGHQAEHPFCAACEMTAILEGDTE